jgi:hypothetical protein
MQETDTFTGASAQKVALTDMGLKPGRRIATPVLIARTFAFAAQHRRPVLPVQGVLGTLSRGVPPADRSRYNAKEITRR